MKKLSMVRILNEIKLHQVLERPSKKFVKALARYFIEQEYEKRVLLNLHGESHQEYKDMNGPMVFGKLFAEWILDEIKTIIKDRDIDIPDRYQGVAAQWIIRALMKDPSQIDHEHWTSAFHVWSDSLQPPFKRTSRPNIANIEKQFKIDFIESQSFWDVHDRLKWVEEFYQMKRFASVDDLNKISSFDELEDIATEAYKKYKEWTKSGGALKEIKKKAKAEKVLSTDQYDVYIPHNKEASIILGLQTKWCTAAMTGHNYFDDYSKPTDPLFIFHSKTETEEMPDGKIAPLKFQIHFGSRSFMDSQDRELGAKKIRELINYLMPLRDRFEIIQEYFDLAEQKETIKMEILEIMNKIHGIFVPLHQKVNSAYYGIENGPQVIKKISNEMVALVEHSRRIQQIMDLISAHRSNQGFFTHSSLPSLDERWNNFAVSYRTVFESLGTISQEERKVLTYVSFDLLKKLGVLLKADGELLRPFL